MTHEVQGSSRWIWCFFFSFTDVTLTFPQFLASGRPLHKLTCSLHLKTNTKFLRLHPWYVFFSARSRNGPDCKTARTTSFFHQTSVFYLPLSYSVLPPCQSVDLSLLKLPSRARETALSCDTNFPTWVAHWLQLNHTKISTLWQQPQLLILHNHKWSLLQSLKCTKAPDDI